MNGETENAAIKGQLVSVTVNRRISSKVIVTIIDGTHIVAGYSGKPVATSAFTPSFPEFNKLNQQISASVLARFSK
ncbi:hypothetical protein ACFL2C_02910 [Patescibacteria group bacterium]